MESLTVFLSSTVVAALVAALVSLRASERKIHVENVTQERAKWRNVMRDLSISLIKATRARDLQGIELCCAQLSLNVNPFDTEDRSLIQVAELLVTVEDKDAQIAEFTKRMALLLKHDWERAKREARPWFFRGEEPKRVPYSEFRCVNAPVPPASKPQKRSLALFWHFSALTFSAGIIFFLAAGLTEPFQNLVKLFNDPQSDKPIGAWVQFVFLSVLCGSMWSIAYLWFKSSEKRFLEIWFTK